MSFTVRRLATAQVATLDELDISSFVLVLSVNSPTLASKSKVSS